MAIGVASGSGLPLLLIPSPGLILCHHHNHTALSERECGLLPMEQTTRFGDLKGRVECLVL